MSTLTFRSVRPSAISSAPRMTSLVGGRVEVRSLSKSFGSRLVLQDLNLEVSAGESVAIVGRSGCGKSTFLRLLAGLETPDTGGIWINDAGVRPADSRLRVMFQESRLLPWKRVIDNVGAGLPPAARARADATLADVGLADRRGDWPGALSGGQQQRVALARALAARPELLLLDEPLGALDALTRLEMQSLIERLWREAGFTLLLVTHDVDEAIALADRVIVMADGNWSLTAEVNLPRPRNRADPTFVRHRESILRAIFAGKVDARAIA